MYPLSSDQSCLLRCCPVAAQSPLSGRVPSVACFDIAMVVAPDTSALACASRLPTGLLPFDISERQQTTSQNGRCVPATVDSANRHDNPGLSTRRHDGAVMPSTMAIARQSQALSGSHVGAMAVSGWTSLHGPDCPRFRLLAPPGSACARSPRCILMDTAMAFGLLGGRIYNSGSRVAI